MENAFKPYIPIAQAICALFGSQVEVVLHDLKTGTIAAIFNHFSKRQVGDDSLIQELPSYDSFPDVFAPYSKTNWDGHAVKSSTATIRDEQGEAIGLFCINFDVEIFKEAQEKLQAFVQCTSTQQDLPQELFKEDWREKISLYIKQALEERGCCRDALTRKEKRELIHELYGKGAFRGKHAAAYVADILNLSRATVYNYLKDETSSHAL